MSVFERSSSPDAEGRICFDPAWNQGRGIYGGIPAAAMVRQMMRRLNRPECILRSLTVHFCRPMEAAESHIDVQSLRTGKRVAHMTAQVRQSSEIVCHASASFGASRDVDLRWEEGPMPMVRPAKNLPPIPLSDVGGPVFAQFFDYRFGGDRFPLSGIDEAILRTWIRPKEPVAIDTPLAVGMLDAMVPAILCRLTEPRPMASVDFRIQLFADFPVGDVDPESHWLLDAQARAMGDGYCEQTTWLYSPSGQLMGSCQQLIAILS
jgi:acyl-CoA thioesterase